MRRIFPYIIQFVVIVLTGLALSRPGLAQEGHLSELLRWQLADEKISWSGAALDWAQLRKFYAPDHRPVWIDARGLTKRAAKWRWLLRSAGAEGLDPAQYHLAMIDQHWKVNSDARRVGLELLLTDAFLRYSVHVQQGQQNPRSVDPDWYIKTPPVDAISSLRNVLAAKKFVTAIKALPPPHAGYRQLRTALARYQKLAKQADWPVVPAKPRLQWGMWHDNIQLLRQRLILSGDLSSVSVAEPRFFDQGLKQAVERFQSRHGLKIDGIVGGSTRNRINMPIDDYIKQIKLNMERWRWLPRDLGERYIMVNTASYQLYVVEHDKPRLAMRVITGTPDRPTPVMNGELSELVINPYWFVPKKIAVEDLIPKQLNNPGFFKRNRIRVMSSFADDAVELKVADIDWKKITAENYPYQLRQDPGPGNSLGNIKFPFINNLSIYLHDTPRRQLFDHSDRAFSSGCVRVEEPVQLAAYLLAGEQGWDEAKILAKIAGGGALKLPLPKPIPVYLVYWTAWVAEDNAVYFQKDIYDRDGLNGEGG